MGKKDGGWKSSRYAVSLNSVYTTATAVLTSVLVVTGSAMIVDQVKRFNENEQPLSYEPPKPLPPKVVARLNQPMSETIPEIRRMTALRAKENGTENPLEPAVQTKMVASATEEKPPADRKSVLQEEFNLGPVPEGILPHQKTLGTVAEIEEELIEIAPTGQG